MLFISSFFFFLFPFYFSFFFIIIFILFVQVLTGGTLVSRNKDYIVFYRGKDFLPQPIMKALKERQKLRDFRQDEEEQARHRASALVDSKAKSAKGPLVAGTLAETLAATSRWGSEPGGEDIEKMMRDSALARHASLVRHVWQKLVHVRNAIN